MPDVVIKNFTVVPSAIVIGGGVTVSWHVVFAETTDGKLHLNGQFVTTIGQKAFHPTQTTPFTLSIVFANGTEKTLVSRAVRVDPVGCQPKLTEAYIIIGALKDEFNKRRRECDGRRPTLQR